MRPWSAFASRLAESVVADEVGATALGDVVDALAVEGSGAEQATSAAAMRIVRVGSKSGSIRGGRRSGSGGR